MTTSKPRKPWYRPRNVVLALLLIVLVAAGWFVREVLRVYYGEPVISVDYRARLQKLCEDAQPPGANAWPLLVEAAELTAQIVAEVEAQGWPPREAYDEGYVDFARVYEHRDVPVEIDRERRALELMRERGVFEMLARALEMPQAVSTYHGNEPLLIDLLPEISKFRLIAKANAARMRLARLEDRRNEVVGAFEQTMNLGHRSALQPGLINLLVGLSIQATVIEELRCELIESELDEHHCRALLAVLSGGSRLPAFSHVIEGERVGLLDLVQRTFTDDGSGNGFIIPSSFAALVEPASAGRTPGLWTAVRARFILADRATSTRMINQVFDAAVADAERSLRERRLNPARDDGPHQARLSPAFVFVGVFLPAMDQAIDNRTIFQLSVAGLRVMTALELHRAQRGTYPDSLDQLMLKERPIDPIQGGLFGYKLLTEDPHGREYLLYSIGLDGTDDGGTPLIEDGAQSFAPLTDFDLTGYDYILNEPRPVGNE